MLFPPALADKLQSESRPSPRKCEVPPIESGNDPEHVFNLYHSIFQVANHPITRSALRLQVFRKGSRNAVAIAPTPCHIANDRASELPGSVDQHH